MGLTNATDDEICDYGLYLVDNILKEAGHSLNYWPSMPNVQQQWEWDSINEMIAETTL